MDVSRVTADGARVVEGVGGEINNSPREAPMVRVSISGFFLAVEISRPS
jgi:hypothetical protein